MATITLAIIFAGFMYYFFLFSPKPSADYFTKIIVKIGTPSGFTVDHTRDDVRGNMMEQPYVRRAYDGKGSKEQITNEMLIRIRAAGFNNASLDGSGNISANCKDISIYTRILQQDDNPIDIEIFQAKFDNAPNCPKF